MLFLSFIVKGKEGGRGGVLRNEEVFRKTVENLWEDSSAFWIKKEKGGLIGSGGGGGGKGGFTIF